MMESFPFSPPPSAMRRARFAIRLVLLIAVLADGLVSAITDLSRASVKAWGPAEGMLEESIFSILEAPHGFIWIATRDGVLRFDGEKFQRIARGDRLDARDFAVGALALTGGRIWLGGRDSILAARPDRFGSFIHVKFDVRRFSRRQDDRFGIASFLERPGGSLMIRRADGIFQIQPDRNSASIPEPVLIAEPPRGESIQAWTVDRHGRHWISTAKGVQWLENGEWKKLTVAPPLVATLLASRDGALYMLGQSGLHRYRDGRIQQLRVPGLRSLEPSRALHEDDSGAVWLGILGGVARIQGDRVEELHLGGYVRPDDLVLTLYQARDGAIWCGTRWGQVVRIAEPKFGVIDRRDGLGESSVSAVAQDGEGRHWIATRTRGVYLEQGQGWRVVPGTGDAVLYAAAPTAGAKMLLASSNGLWISDGSTTRRLQKSPHPHLFARYHTFSARVGDAIYYSDSEHIWRLKVRKDGELAAIEHVAKFPLVRAIVPAEDGLWLLGWEDGLARYSGGNLQVFGLGPGPVRRGMTLWAFDREFLVVGTSEGGRVFDRKTMTFLDRPPMFPDEHLFQLQEDGAGQVWILGRRALLSLPRQVLADFIKGRQRTITATQYTPRLGLPSANFGLGTSATSLLDRQGELWLASLGGAIRFRPQDVSPDIGDIRCAILGLRANGAPVDLTGEIRLPAGTNRVQIQYTTAGPWISEDPVIHYQLEGSTVGRMDTGSKEAVFTNLGPGRYRFRIAASLASRGRNGPETVLDFDIEPFPYQRVSVQVLAGLLLAAALVGAYWYRRRAIERHTRELEQRVEERTAQLAAARNEAERARQKAEAAARAKSDFLATMSHEIRTPMNGVIGMIQLLEATSLTSQQREQLAIMRSSGEILMTIVNDMLDLSKIETGSLQLEHVDFGLTRLVEESIELFRPQAAARGLDLTLELAPDLPAYVNGDPTRFGQVLMNLLSNAMKFTEQGGVRVSVARVPGAPDQIVFSVKDSGIGIPEDKLGEIFKAFTQAESSTTRRFGGTGLGLTICDRLVSAMGGTITVKSKLGEGSEFSFVLPLKEVREPVLEANGNLQEPSLLPPPGLRVLVVEDNAVNRRIAEALLLKFGCQVLTAEDGLQAVERASSQRFDVIFMDCHMPELDGYEAARRIRALPGEAGAVPIIALTASASAEDRQRSYRAGMTHHISKPVTMEDLRKALVAVAPRDAETFPSPQTV
jgi:signal transduction histidine kinase/CheY-like chemotaxis protein/ligand-binding sensor domain-containing protein